MAAQSRLRGGFRLLGLEDVQEKTKLREIEVAGLVGDQLAVLPLHIFG